MSEPEIPWTRYDQAYKRIHDAIRSDLASAPAGKRITKITYTYNEAGDVSEIQFFQGSTLLFKLQFTYDSQGRLIEVNRIE